MNVQSLLNLMWRKIKIIVDSSISPWIVYGNGAAQASRSIFFDVCVFDEARNIDNQEKNLA